MPSREMVDTLICGAVAMAAPLPLFQLDVPNTFKEIPVAVHFYDDTLDAYAVFENLDPVFLPLGFGLYVDTVTFHSTEGHPWSESYADTTSVPPFHYSVTTGIASLGYMPNRMNVYVLPYLANDVGGFSYIPPYQSGAGRHPADGVWVRSDLFSTSTLTHEIGHFLGLYHVFQGVSYCGEDSELHDALGHLYGDLVTDTPPIKPTGNCTYPNCPPSWPAFRPWFGYVHDNFMDYMNDTCRTAFTPGQVARMHSYMAVYRPNEYNELGLPAGDINGDGIVGTLDLLFVLSCLNPTMIENCEPADLDYNAIVSIFDLLVVLSNYGL